MSPFAVQAARDDDMLSGAQALELRRMIAGDERIAHAHVEALLALNTRVCDTDPEWTQVYGDALCAFLRGDAGAADPKAHQAAGDDVTWLINAIARAGGLANAANKAALSRILEQAHPIPTQIAARVRDMLLHAVLAAHDARIDALDAALVKAILRAPAETEQPWVTRAEAEWLLALDAAAAASTNHQLWTDVFVGAIANHVAALTAPPALQRAQLLRRARFLQDLTGVGADIRRLRASWGMWRGVAAQARTAAPNSADACAMAGATPAAPAIERPRDTWLAERLLGMSEPSANVRAFLAWLAVELPEFLCDLQSPAAEAQAGAPASLAEKLP